MTFNVVQVAVMKARKPRRTAWITWGSNANEGARIPALRLKLRANARATEPNWAALKPRCSNVLREANRVRMGEGREDRTQIEAVITVPKTDHNVERIAP